MDLQHVAVPIALFAFVAYGFKCLLDAIVRHRMLRESGTLELLRPLLEAEADQRRLGSLRWGLMLVFLAIGFAIVARFGSPDVTPASIAILAGSVGLAQLTYFALTRRRSS
jgi:hypothetical protein